MLSLIFKTVLLYTIVVISLRVMGKRQIGELQPSELVITLLVSEIAALPIQETNRSIKTILVPLATLILFELLISLLNIKSVHFRNLLQGSAIIIIRDGVVDQGQLKRLRYSMEDVLEELRKKDIFDISEVQYAIAETDGTISVMPKPGKRPVTPEDLKIEVENDTIPVTVIDDGVIIKNNLPECDLTEKSFEKFMKKKNLDKKDILFLSMTSSGNYTIIKKDTLRKK
ncbi:MAG: DUF421 domain-containing protein [Clostridia bacterium]|nr:DUF421 domain-containing protein [Clostridia bacterium]